MVDAKIVGLTAEGSRLIKAVASSATAAKAAVDKVKAGLRSDAKSAGDSQDSGGDKALTAR
jgi:hypothetical protein